jgi:hypothetical protein
MENSEPPLKVQDLVSDDPFTAFSVLSVVTGIRAVTVVP